MQPLLSALQNLVEADVEFIVVGGLACVIQGAPIMTFDIDIVHQRTEANVDRLMMALGKVQATYRTRNDLRPNREALMGPGHHLLQTRHGQLDVLGAIEGGAGYDALLPYTVQIEVAGAQYAILGLDEIIRLKQMAPRDKDKAQLPILLATANRLRE